MLDSETQNGVFDPDAEVAPEADAPAQVADETPEPETGGNADAQGVMRWAEFNRRAAELKRREEALEARYRGYEELDRALESDDVLRQEVASAFERRRGQSRPAASPQNDDLRAIRDELSETRMELLANRIQTEADRLQRTEKMSAEETQAVIKHALEEGLLDPKTPRDKIGKRLQTAFRDLNFGKAKGAGERELVEKLREGQRAASPGGRPKGTDSDAEPEYNVREMSYEQIAQAEMKRMGVKR